MTGETDTRPLPPLYPYQNFVPEDLLLALAVEDEDDMEVRPVSHSICISNRRHSLLFFNLSSPSSGSGQQALVPPPQRERHSVPLRRR